MDLSVGDRGQKHRTDISQDAPQGELAGDSGVVRHHAQSPEEKRAFRGVSPEGVELPSFVELPSSSNSSPLYRESGEVPPPTDEAGQAEIRGEHVDDGWQAETMGRQKDVVVCGPHALAGLCSFRLDTLCTVCFPPYSVCR